MNVFHYFSNQKNAICKQKMDPYSRLTYSSWVSTRFFKDKNGLYDFFNSITNIKIIPADSNSHSLFFTSDMPHQIINADPPKKPRESTKWHQQLYYYSPKLFVKMSTTYEKDYKFKEIEPIIYTHIINRMLQEYRSPHFMLYLGHQFIPKWDHFIQQHTYLMNIDVRQQVFDAFTRKFEEELNTPASQGGHLLVLECGQGIKWENFLDQLTFYSDQEFYKIMFQILYTLWTMDLVGLTHYDLHAGNIFLEEVKNCDDNDMVYIINSKECIQIVRPMFMARLYDWDYGYVNTTDTSLNRSYHSSSKRLLNDIKQSRKGWISKETGNDNRHFSYYDVFKVFINLLRHKKTPDSMKQFIRKQFHYSSSQDPNLNLLLRIDYCLSSRGKPGACRSHDLCELVFNHHYHQWDCQGPYKFRPDVMNDIKTIFVDFVQTFHSFNYFKKIPKNQFHSSSSTQFYCPDPKLRQSWIQTNKRI